MAVKTVQAKFNGQTITLTLNSSTGKYEASVTAPNTSSFKMTGGYYPVEITATDTAGNTVTKTATDTTLGASLQLKVKETTPPVISLTAPTSGAHLGSATPAITWTVMDADSGVKESSISIKIDNGAAITTGITKTAVSNGYNCSYTPTSLADGSHTIYLNASDNDGNAATQLTSTFTVDTIPPVLTVSAPADKSVTNNATCTVTGSTNDDLTTLASVTVNGNTVTVGNNGTFTTTVTLTAGSNTITVISTDATGKTTTVTRTVTLDQTPPSITAVSISPNPATVGQSFLISVTVTDT